MKKDANASYYEVNAEEYIGKTFSLDMSSSRAAFLKFIPAGGYILDVGFGSGRDSLYFGRAGYRVLGIDVVSAFVRHARELGIEAKEESVLDIAYEGLFDGVYASASLLHLEENELEEALLKIRKSLKSGGILYASFKYGVFAGFRDSRYYLDMTCERMKPILKKSGFEFLSYEMKEDEMGRGNKWIEFLAKRQTNPLESPAA